MDNDEPWAFDGPPTEPSAYELSHVSRHKPTAKKRSGSTPEAKVLKACIKYLEDLDCYVLRTSAGFTSFDGRNVSIGRAGLPDILCCIAGKFVAVECKAERGRVSEAQQRQHEFIRRRNGIVIIPHSVDELRAGLVAAFGETTIRDWETLGRARKRR